MLFYCSEFLDQLYLVKIAMQPESGLSLRATNGSVAIAQRKG
jgi:hypothetical protein